MDQREKQAIIRSFKARDKIISTREGQKTWPYRVYAFIDVPYKGTHIYGYYKTLSLAQKKVRALKKYDVSAKIQKKPKYIKGYW